MTAEEAARRRNMTTATLDELEAMLKKGFYTNEAAHDWEMALHNAAPRLIAAARENERLREALKEAARPPDSNVSYIATTLLEMHERQLVAALATDDDGAWEKNRADYRSACIASAAILAAGFLSARVAALEEAARVADEGVLVFDGGKISTPADMKLIASMTSKVIASGIRALQEPKP